MALKKQCEIGFWIEGSKGKVDIQASFKDCCPRCGKPVASLQDRCCDKTESHSTLSVELQQQLLLNWMAAASYEEKPAVFWRCARCVLLSQWLSQSSQKRWLLSKRRLPDPSDLDSVLFFCSRYGQLLLPPSHAVRWLVRSLLVLSLLPQTSLLLKHLLSILDGAAPRLMASTLSSLQQILSFSPSLLASPSIQHALATALSASQLPSILDKIIDIFEINVKEFASQPLVLRTILSLALRSESKPAFSRAFHFISLVLKSLLSSDPLPVQQIVQIEHLILKHIAAETDQSVRELSFGSLALCWEVRSLPLHAAIVDPLVDSRSSLVPQDVVLCDLLSEALKKPSCQTVIVSEIEELLSMQASEIPMKLLLFSLSTVQHPISNGLPLLKSLLQGSPSIRELQVALQLVQKTDSHDWTEIEGQITPLIQSIDSAEGLKVIAEMIVQIGSSRSIASTISKCLQSIRSSRGSTRFMLLLGHIYQLLNCARYKEITLIARGCDYQQIVHDLSAHLLTKNDLLKVQCIQACFQCLLHNPNKIDTLLLDSLSEVRSNVCFNRR